MIERFFIRTLDKIFMYVYFFKICYISNNFELINIILFFHII